MRLLRCFYLVCRLKIRIPKSNVHIAQGLIERRNHERGVDHRMFPTKLAFAYLVLLFGVKMYRVEGRKNIIDKFNNKLSKREVKMLLIGGRTTL